MDNETIKQAETATASVFEVCDTTDEEGRFNLNALHRASGLGDHKKPSEWLRTNMALALIDELEKQDPSEGSDQSGNSRLAQEVIRSVKGGNFPGTFAHELLAISYAGWISPAFQLKVNQVFLDYRTGKLQSPAVPQSLPEALRLAADLAEKNQHLQIENSQQADKIDKLENFFHPGMTIAAFGKMLNGVNCAQITNYCHETLNWLYNESRSGLNRRWRVRSYARDRYLTETDRPIGTHGGETFIRYEPKLLQAGAKKLYDLYLAGELPMKKTWNGEYSHMKFTEAKVA